MDKVDEWIETVKKDKKLDSVELEYEIAIRGAINKGNNDHCLELSIGLNQYRELYKVEQSDEQDNGKW